jgi:hypothetical protein
VGEGGTILHSSDGGAGWSPQVSRTTAELMAVQFVDANTGWIAGLMGTYLMTTDGGETWDAPVTGIGDALNALSFFDARNGWLGGNFGVTYHTTDGGVTWSNQHAPSNQHVLALAFISPTTGWALGANGMLMKTTSGGITGVEDDGRTEANQIGDFRLLQNYPNPFNPSTQISFYLPLDAKVSVRIYNITGQLVATLINDELRTAGIQSVTFDASDLASGIYFYRLDSDNFSDTKKMLFVK